MSSTQPAEKSKGGSGKIITIAIGALVFIFCVLPICIIAILTLMGPSIANVFSKITNGFSP